MYDTDRYEPLGLALGQKLIFIHKDNLDSVPLGLIGVIKEIVCTDKLKKKFSYVEVESENVDGSMIFSGVDIGESGKGTWEESEIKEDRALRTLEAVCVQHEIDHLNGVVCMDRKIDTTYRAEKKPGRNEPCYCGSGKKYKKCCIGK